MDKEGAIPRLIHQTWKTSVVPDKWASSPAKYKALEAEGWTYRLWTDEDNRNLIRDHYPWFLKQFDAYPYPIQRADAVRYFILHKYGGIYSDLDIQPKANFTAFYNLYKHAELCLPATKAGNAFGGQNYSNCFMMSAPNCAFWPLVWEHLKDPFGKVSKDPNRKTMWWKTVLGKAHYFEVLFTTGPGIICDTAAEYQGDIVALPAQLVQPGVEADKPPVSRPESVVELLRGESWQQGDANFWRTCGTVMNNVAWVLLGLCIFLVLMVIFLAVKLKRRNKLLTTARFSASASKSSSQVLSAKNNWIF